MKRNWKITGFLVAALAASVATVACVQAAKEPSGAGMPDGDAAFAQVKKVEPTGVPTAETGWKEEMVVDGLRNPWGMAWLPDGKMLVTMLSGTLYLVDPKSGSRSEVSGLPPTTAVGQGGLMDVSLHPKFVQNGLVYFTQSQGERNANHTTLVRGKLVGDRLEDVQTLFTPNFAKQGGQHFGSRILWLPDGTLLMSLGDGGNPPSAINGKLTRHYVQDLDSHIGKLLRLDENGKAPKDNPFAGTPGASPEIYSLGHRNIQGLARDPGSGRVYANEHGARGGDEVNLIKKGANYGWPKVTFSMEYSGPKISDSTSMEGMEDPIVAWTPCPAPCGLAFYTGGVARWKGDLFSGGLAGQDVRRIDLDAGGKVLGITQFKMGARVRDVRQGPDGNLYFMMEGANGRISRIVPE